MKATLNQLLLAVVLALSGCTTCNPEQSAAGNDAGGQQQEIQAGDADGGAILADAAEQMDVAESTDAGYPDADGGAAVDGDAATDLDQADAAAPEVVVGPPVPPTSECGEGVMSTPQPGDECETVGVTRCSDVDSKWITGLVPFAVEKQYCHRPNILECLPSLNGVNRWLVKQCPNQMTTCLTKPKLATMTCQDIEGAAVCGVLKSSAGEQSDWLGSALHPCSEFSAIAGALGCAGGGLWKCGTIQNAMPATGYPWVQDYLDKYAQLKTCCPTCRYWLPYKTCADMNIGVCWGWQNPEQGVKKAPVCLENIPGKPPSCVYTCEDLKYSEEYGKPPWRK